MPNTPDASVDHTAGFSHHARTVHTGMLREAVFGLEDGMVSTFGAITGIAAATADYSTVVLSGCVIIAVESVSMAVGSYLANRSEADVQNHMLSEERQQLAEFPVHEKQELLLLYLAEGWPAEVANKMVEAASKDDKLFLREMAFRELGIVPEKIESALTNALVMGVSYVVGGFVPLVSYLILPLSTAIYSSVFVTLLVLFMLGVSTTRFTMRTWWKAGLEMLILASVAGGIGYLVGQLVKVPG